jgi:anti-anti-sigma factor
MIGHAASYPDLGAEAKRYCLPPRHFLHCAARRGARTLVGRGNLMDISQERDGDVVIVRLSGRLDSGAATAAEESLSAALVGDMPRLAIDMSGLAYISSAGLRALLVVAKKVQQAKGKLALGGLGDNVREVFDATGFNTIFAIEADSASAVAAVR